MGVSPKSALPCVVSASILPVPLIGRDGVYGRGVPTANRRYLSPDPSGFCIQFLEDAAVEVELTRQYVRDVYETTKRVHDSTDMMAVMARTAEAEGGWDNKYLLFQASLDQVIAEAAAEVQARWSDKLAGVDVFVDSHVRTALIYVRWDD